jgi:hypothetical protein
VAKFWGKYFERRPSEEGQIFQMALGGQDASIPPQTGSIRLLALFPLASRPEKGSYAMTKSLETISEAIQNPKHPFPQVADRPDKPHKNRYERRKVKQYIQLGDWAPEGK